MYTSVPRRAKLRNQIRAKELKIYVLCLLKYSRISLTKKKEYNINKYSSSWSSSSFATHVSFNVYDYFPFCPLSRVCVCVPFFPLFFMGVLNRIPL